MFCLEHTISVMQGKISLWYYPGKNVYPLEIVYANAKSTKGTGHDEASKSVPVWYGSTIYCLNYLSVIIYISIDRFTVIESLIECTAKFPKKFWTKAISLRISSVYDRDQTVLTDA